LFLGVIACSGARGQVPAPPSDEDLSRQLTTVRAQVEDLAIDLARREELVLQMASTLDAAAQNSTLPDARRRRWSDAVELIDWFLKRNADPPRERQLRFQAAVYLWAQGNSWQRTWLATPTDTKARDQAAAAFDSAIDRLRSVSGDGNNKTLADNLRFRLAESLADRADLEPAGSPDRLAGEREALGLMDDAMNEPGLAGFWHVLKADLMRRTGKPAEATRELDLAVKSNPPAPESEVLDVRVRLLVEQKRFEPALELLKSSRLDAAAKGFWSARVRLAQMAAAPEGPERFAVEQSLFQTIKDLRSASVPESRLALLELARSGLSPEERHDAEVWEVMAEAYAAAGDSARAGGLLERAGRKAAGLGKPAEAAGYRLRAGAYLFQADRFAEADVMLSQVADDPAAGALRARAGMLRALARGRAAKARSDGSLNSAYVDALERQLHDFPDDPITNEARWLLGVTILSTGNRARARELWARIPAGAARWLDSRLAAAALDRDELERLQINPEPASLAARFRAADQFLSDSLRASQSELATVELELARARLNLTPSVGQPDIALTLSDQVARSPVSQAMLYRARLYRLVALVELGRYLEAERLVQSHATWAVASELDTQIEVVRLLDRAASTAENDVRQRRFGLVARWLLEPLVSDDGRATSSQLAELRMHLTRSFLFIGDDRNARNSMASWRGVPLANDDQVLRELGDTYSRLGVYALDIDVQRLRIKNNPAGSIAWFDARYALALAYFHTGQLKEAAQLIDSTSILHPELGGGALRDKFIRLRQRLGAAK
jgi:TolA-binding protein